MDLSKYDLSNLSPDKYVAIAVEDLLRNADKEKLHIEGTPSKEYIGMLALYAIKRAKSMFKDGEQWASLVSTAYEYFDPFNMSDELVKCLSDMILEN